jgi:phage terminase large subunit-like protein
VFLVRGEWIPVFLQEILEFPKGKHDDQVDTASGGLEAIAKGSSSGIYV